MVARQFTPALAEVTPETVDDFIGIGVEARAGDSDHLDPMQLQLLLSPSIALERSVAPMKVEDVKFNGEEELRPIRVEHVAVN